VKLKFHNIKINFSGLILGVMFFVLFAAACNTQSGWQYMISSLCLSLLVIGLLYPLKSIQSVVVEKKVLPRYFAGRTSNVEILIFNNSNAEKHDLSVIESPLISKNQSFDLLDNLNFFQKVGLYFYKRLFPDDKNSYYFVKTLEPQGYLCLNHKFVPQKRGVFVSGAINIFSSLPLGLFSCFNTYTPDLEIVVYPKIVEMKADWINRVASGSSFSELSYTYVHSCLPGATRNLRDYNIGDSIKHIHWPSSAKADKLLVREFEVESSGSVIVVLDNSNYYNQDFFELAITTAASILNVCNDSKMSAELVVFDDVLVENSDLNLMEFASQLEILARLSINKNLSRKMFIEKLNAKLYSLDSRERPVLIVISSEFNHKMVNYENTAVVTVAPGVDKHSKLVITCDEDLRYL
jgi:hypothetical protein